MHTVHSIVHYSKHVLFGPLFKTRIVWDAGIEECLYRMEEQVENMTTAHVEEDELQQSMVSGGLNPERDVVRRSGYFNLHVIIHNNRKTSDDSDETKDPETYARSLLEPLFHVIDSSVQEGMPLNVRLSRV